MFFEQYNLQLNVLHGYTILAMYYFMTIDWDIIKQFV